MNRNGRLHALLATARVANIPSVIVNVWCGAALAFVLGGKAALPLVPVFLLAAAGVLLYVGGNLLNDWMDRDWDAVKRPERALPSGKFQAATYLSGGCVCSLLGIALAAVASPVSAAIAALIAGLVGLYTWIHKRTAWSVLPMGLCRALLPVMAAAGVTGGFSTVGVFPGLALLAYIAGLSLTARFESMEEIPSGFRRLARLLFFIPPALGIRMHLDAGALPILTGLLPYGLWMAACDLMRRMKLFRFVSFLLAGIPWVDGIFLLPIGIASGMSGFGVACLVLPPLAFGSALLLQRLAPAT